MRHDFLPKEQALVSVHQLALADRGASLHAGNIAGPFLQTQSRHSRGNRARGHDQIFVFRKVELVDHAAQQIDIDLPAGGDKTGADFDDYSHILRGVAISLSCCSRSSMETRRANPDVRAHEGQ